MMQRFGVLPGRARAAFASVEQDQDARQAKVRFRARVNVGKNKWSCSNKLSFLV